MSEKKRERMNMRGEERKKTRVEAVVWEAGCLEADIFRTGIINRTQPHFLCFYTHIHTLALLNPST